MKLILDFIPKHSAVSDPTTTTNRKFYARSSEGKKDSKKCTISGLSYGKIHIFILGETLYNRIFGKVIKKFNESLFNDCFILKLIEQDVISPV